MENVGFLMATWWKHPFSVLAILPGTRVYVNVNIAFRDAFHSFWTLSAAKFSHQVILLLPVAKPVRRGLGTITPTGSHLWAGSWGLRKIVGIGCDWGINGVPWFRIWADACTSALRPKAKLKKADANTIDTQETSNKCGLQSYQQQIRFTNTWPHVTWGTTTDQSLASPASPQVCPLHAAWQVHLSVGRPHSLGISASPDGGRENKSPRPRKAEVAET